MAYTIRPVKRDDAEWVKWFIADRWKTNTVVVHGVSYQPHRLPGYVAVEDDEIIGLVTYTIDDPSCELVTLDSIAPARGIGSALVEAVENLARVVGCTRLWLITTNDNLSALRFFQKRDFVLVALYRNIIERSRRLKPEIPETGNEGIPIRDELELEKSL